MLKLHVPQAALRSVAKGLAPRPESLDGKGIAICDNGKPNAGPFMERVAKLLGQRFKLARVVTFKRIEDNKGNYWDYHTIGGQLINYPGQIDLAITGMGD